MTKIKRKNIPSGEIFNGIEFIGYVGRDESYNRIGIFLCWCGAIFKQRVSKVVNAHVKGCGCKGKRKRLVGAIYNGCKLLEIDGHIHNAIAGRYKCFCGKEFRARCYSVEDGDKRSCGCLVIKKEPKEESLIKRKINRYSKKQYPSEYEAWSGAKKRCYNKNVHNFADYGGRYIYMSDEWLRGFDKFMDDMGPKPSPIHSLDRINVDGPYSKENCRWSTPKEQSNNRRSNVNITINGVIKYFCGGFKLH